MLKYFNNIQPSNIRFTSHQQLPVQRICTRMFHQFTEKRFECQGLRKYYFLILSDSRNLKKGSCGLNNLEFRGSWSKSKLLLRLCERITRRSSRLGFGGFRRSRRRAQVCEARSWTRTCRSACGSNRCCGWRNRWAGSGAPSTWHMNINLINNLLTGLQRRLEQGTRTQRRSWGKCQRECGHRERSTLRRCRRGCCRTAVPLPSCRVQTGGTERVLPACRQSRHSRKCGRRLQLEQVSRQPFSIIFFKIEVGLISCLSMLNHLLISLGWFVFTSSRTVAG